MILLPPRRFTVHHAIGGNGNSSSLIAVLGRLAAMDVAVAHCLYEHDFGRYPRLGWGGQHGGIVINWTTPDWEAHFGQCRTQLAGMSLTGPLILDFESMNPWWDHLDPAHQASVRASRPRMSEAGLKRTWEAASCRLLTTTLNIIEECAPPHLKPHVGLYGWPDSSGTEFYARAPFKNVIGACRTLYPSLYAKPAETFGEWLVRAAKTMETAREMAPAKPVRFLLSPLCTNGTPVEPAFFEMQLAASGRFGAEGVVVWASPKNEAEASVVADVLLGELASITMATRPGQHRDIEAAWRLVGGTGA